MRELVRYLASLSFRTSSSVTEEGIHRSSRSEPDIVEGLKRLKLELWVLELKARGGFDWIEKKGVEPWSLYKGVEYQEPSP